MEGGFYGEVFAVQGSGRGPEALTEAAGECNATCCPKPMTVAVCYDRRKAPEIGPPHARRKRRAG
jgi:hypothetical protein